MTRSISSAEHGWLDWTWDLLQSHPDHAPKSGRARVAAIAPGFVGPRYELGGVLVLTVAAPPVDDRADSPGGAHQRVLTGLKEWWKLSGRSPEVDRTFLDRWFAAFEAALDEAEPGERTPWWERRVGWFTESEQYLGRRRSELVHLNVASCRRTGSVSATAMVDRCRGDHDINDLIRTLAPDLIVGPSTLLPRFVRGTPDPTPLIVGWDGRNFHRERPNGEGTEPREAWAPRVLSEVGRRRSPHARSNGDVPHG